MILLALPSTAPAFSTIQPIPDLLCTMAKLFRPTPGRSRKSSQSKQTRY